MPAAKRKAAHGGARPGAGRKPAQGDGYVTQLSVPLYDADTERIARLQALWGGSQASVVRRALEMADDMQREG